MPKGRDISTAIEIRRGEVERIANAQSQNFKVTGEIQINGVGEAIKSVMFPVLFTEKPVPGFGPQLGPGQLVVAGQLPTCSVVVLQWHEYVRDDGSVIYAGATFGIVTTGPAGQVMHLGWSMEEVGLRGPIENA